MAQPESEPRTTKPAAEGAKGPLAVRVAVMLVGVAFVACAIALARHAGLGTSAINCTAAVSAEAAKRAGNSLLTLGFCTFVLNFALFLLQVALLRRRFDPYQVLQLPLLVVMSTVVDLWAALFDNLVLDGYAPRFVALACSVAIMALGVYLELRAGLLMTPGDAFVRALAQVTGHDYSRDKVIVDVTLVCCGAALSLALLGGLFHVREGTVVSALFVGPMISVWGKVLDKPVGRLLGARG